MCVCKPEAIEFNKFRVRVHTSVVYRAFLYVVEFCSRNGNINEKSNLNILVAIGLHISIYQGGVSLLVSIANAFSLNGFHQRS